MRQLTNPDGTPMTLGVSSLQGIGETAGVRFVSPGEVLMSKAGKDGIYTLHGNRFVIAAGDELPDGAELDAEDADTEERAKGKAAQNRANGPAPENRGV